MLSSPKLNEVPDLVSVGFAVHWLRPNSKVPVEKAWSCAPRKTWAQLCAHYKDGLNVGVRLGKWSKISDAYLHVIDLDIRNDDFIDQAHERLISLFPGYESLPFVISGSGGESRHFYFVSDKPFASKKLARSEGFDMLHDPKKGRAVKKHHWEIELFGSGKQVAMPPSIHPDTGAEYTWGREFDFDLIDLGISPRIPSSQVEKMAEIRAEFDPSEADYRPPLGMSLHQASGYLEALPLDQWCEDRDGWYKVGMALHHEFANRGLENEAFEIWCRFSSKSSKFDINNTRNVWKSFENKKAKNIRMATVVQAASHARLETQFCDVDLSDNGLSQTDSIGAGPVSGPANSIDIDDLLGHSDGRLDKSRDILEDMAGEKGARSNEWMVRLELNEQGAIKNTFGNIHIIIENDIRTHGMFERNLLLNGDVFRNPPARLNRQPEPKGGSHQIAGPAWYVSDQTNGELVLDVHVATVREMLTVAKRRGGWGLSKPAATDVRDSIEIISRKNAFHPIQDYLRRLEWDGVSRVEQLFVDYLGTDDDFYHRDTARLTMLAAVTRAFEPGHKFDYVPVIEGGQGVRKSTFIEVLAAHPSWFGELSSDFGDPARMIESMQGRWIMELAEMSGMNRSDVNDIKKFVTQTHDRVRLAYERSAANYARQSIIMGSTNDDAYLRDDTGGRRFWPIRCLVSRVGGNIPIEKLKNNRDQLWAEAVQMYLKMREKHPHGPLPLYLSDDRSRRHAERLQAIRRVSNVWDDWAAQIDEWADTPISSDDGFDGDAGKFPRQKICALEIFNECLGMNGKPTQQDSTYIGNAMKQLSEKWSRSERVYFPKGSSQDRKYGKPRGWVRKAARDK